MEYIWKQFLPTELQVLADDSPADPQQTISQYKVQVVGLDDGLSRGVAGFCGRQAAHQVIVW